MLCQMVRTIIVQKKGYFRHALKDFYGGKNRDFMLKVRETIGPMGGSFMQLETGSTIHVNHGISNMQKS